MPINTDLMVVVTDKDGVTTTMDSHASDPGYRPQGLTCGSQQGTGFYTAGFHVSWPIDREHPSLHLRDKVQIIGAAGDIAYEGFITDLPRSTDAEGRGTLTVTLVGYMADTGRATFRMPFVDRDLAHFTIESSMARRAGLLSGGFLPQGTGTVTPDPAGAVCLVQQFDRVVNTTGSLGLLESWYDAGPDTYIGSVYVDLVSYDKGAGGVSLTGSWMLSRMLSNDTIGTSVEGGAVGGTYAGYYTATALDRRYMFLQVYYGGTVTADGLWSATWRNPAVYGDHGLPLIGDTDPKGVAASDVVRWLIDRYCPKLSSAGVQSTTYSISHLAFRDRTTVYDAILKVNSFHLWQLAVWEDGVVHFGPVDLTNWDWEIRHDEPGNQIALQGDSVENLRNGIVVSFTNVATGQPEELHPDDWEQLRDDSLENPYNQHGDTAYGEAYAIPFPTTQANALELGRLKMLEDNAVRAPGTITIGPWARDRSGELQPVWKIRSGDRVRITSSVSLSDRPRLVHEVSYSHDSRSATVAVDSTLRYLEGFVDRVLTSLAANNLAV